MIVVLGGREQKRGLHLLAAEDQTLLDRWNTFLFLNLFLDLRHLETLQLFNTDWLVFMLSP